MTTLRFGIAFVVLSVCGACDHRSPTGPIAPAQAVLTGHWIGSLTNRFGGPTALGDWSRLVLTLESTGDGELVTNDDRHFAVRSRVSGDIRILDLVFTPSSVCTAVVLSIMSVQTNASGQVDAFSGQIGGRCPNTLMNTFTFAKGSVS